MDGTTLSYIAVRTARRKRLTLLTLCLAVLVAQVDTSVVNLAIRPIGQYFAASLGELQWAVDSYNLAYAVLLLTGGVLADIKGRRLIFMTGAAIFTAGSLVCAFASATGVLITGRAVAGVGAALLIPASLAIIRVEWPDPAERGRALGIWTGCNGVALAIGPTLGGLLIHQLGWRSIFLLVVPVGLAALILAPLLVPESADPQDRDFDALAQILGAAALGGLAFAAIESHTSLSLALGGAVLALAALIAFVKVEARKGMEALVPLNIFRVRAFRGAVTATAGMTFGMYGALFLVPLTWQSAGRLSATGAGLALMPMALAFVLASPFSGMLTGKLGTRVLTSGGVSIIGCGLLLLGLSADLPSILPAETGLALTGLGMGLATGPLMGAAVGAVAAARAGTASALINAARMAGATIGVAILGAVFALMQSGPGGLKSAMVLGGLVQIACAGVAWRSTKPRG
jgi:EmrB/QacA subfamily drug resistance transporter